MASMTLADEVEDFRTEAEDDYVGLWEIAHRVAGFAMPPDEVREASLEIVRRLLDRGLVAGDLTSNGGFRPWPKQDPASVADHIRQEWTALGRPPSIGEIAWFNLPG